MISITTNIKEVSARLLRKLYAISSKPNLDAMSREIAITAAAHMRERIHEAGRDSASTQIGTYAPEYLKERQRKTKRHPRYGSDPKVILSLSRDMQNDFTLGISNPEPEKTQDGYGIGFKNNFNFRKSQWMEKKYKKKIFGLTKDEISQVRIVAEDFINRAIQKI